MTKLQSGMLSLVMLCLVRNGVARLAVVCFLASMFFFFGPGPGKRHIRRRCLGGSQSKLAIAAGPQ